MKKVVLLIFIFTLIIVFCHKSIAEKESHVFGIVTRHIALSPSAVQEGCVPFANYINSKLNLSVKVKIVPELSDLIDGLQNGNIDWGFVGSLDYVKLKDKMNITPIVKVYKGGTSKYRAIILVRKDSGINSLDDLKGKTFVYSSVNSAHGYLYPSVLIKSKYNQTFNNFFGNIIKTKKDVDGVYAVYYKKADVVATSETAFSILCELTPKLKRELKVIASSEPMIYGPVFYYDKNIEHKEDITKLKDLLLDMDKIVEGQQTLLLFKMSAWKFVEDSEYNSIRSLLKQSQ